MIHLALPVNGEPTEVAFAPYKTLLEVLREDLNLCGTKHGCELGECGACAVLLDGQPVLSCLVLGVECGGREVTTVEGLVTDGRLHPLQERSPTSARRSAATARRDSSSPRRRCSTSTRTRRATRSARRSPAISAAAPATSRSSRRSKRRSPTCGASAEPHEEREAAGRDGDAAHERHRQAAPARRRPRQGHRPDQVRRRHRAAADGALQAAALAAAARAHRPHRRVARAGASRRLPGPHRQGLPDPLRHPAGQPGRARARHRQRALRRRSGRRGHRARRADRVRGARPDRRRVRAAARPSPIPRRPRRSPSRASTTTATAATSTRTCRSGSATSTQAFADADRVFEDTFFYQGNTHLPIEQHAAVAANDPDGKLMLWSARRRRTTCIARSPRCSRMPAAHIRVIATPNGGGFGGKSDPFNHEIVVAKAALLLGRPVKICLTREEVFYCHRGRHPVLMQFKTGVKHDGTITGDALADAARRRRVRLVRRREHVLHRRAADRDLSRPALHFRGLPRVHQQAAVRPEARPRHAAEPVRPGDPARQDRRERSRSIRPSCACASSSSRTR